MVGQHAEYHTHQGTENDRFGQPDVERQRQWIAHNRSQCVARDEGRCGGHVEFTLFLGLGSVAVFGHVEKPAANPSQVPISASMPKLPDRKPPMRPAAKPYEMPVRWSTDIATKAMNRAIASGAVYSNVSFEMTKCCTMVCTSMSTV